MIHTQLCDRLGIDHPIVQAGMATAVNTELVSAVSEAGGLGILGCLSRSKDDTLDHVRRIRAATNRPFGVNFVLPFLDEDTFRACLAEHIPVFAFFRGDPAEAVARAHEIGAVTIHQVTTIVEAERACEAGVDVLIAQGYEAGGHMGPLPLLSLLPEVVAVADQRPVIAAGGMVDGKGLAAALCLGAEGVLMGTRFLATPECWIHSAYKQAILDAQPGDTVASDVFDTFWGKWPGVQVRAIRNKLMDWIGREEEMLARVEQLQAEFATANEVGDQSMMGLLAGTGSGRIHTLKPAGDIVRDTVSEAETILQRMGQLVN